AGPAAVQAAARARRRGSVVVVLDATGAASEDEGPAGATVVRCSGPNGFATAWAGHVGARARTGS
ncbi:MAG TPA: hypothetical protein VGP53_04880, partial [Acidimicrobiales bacterium]|nr:hypothetical protein [Acidimicrobiales bacterium]